MKPFALACALAGSLGLSMPAHGQGIPGYPNVEEADPREVAMLPRYCIHTQVFSGKVPGGNNEEEIRRWKSMLGPTFLALHHYCWGLMRTNRALFLTRNKQLREFYLDTSIDEFNYVLREAPPDFVLLPEILTKKGENLIRRGKGPLAVPELRRAMQLKPDYWPPYVALSDYLRDIGDLATAREVAKQGLVHAPDATLLRRRLAELDAGEKKVTKAAKTATK